MPDNAYDWLVLIDDLHYDYDGCRTTEGLKELLDEIALYARAAKKCIQEGKIVSAS